jgi:hypothetical protein
MMSRLPQGQLAVYVVQDDDEPLNTKGLRAAYTVQGNDEPLATMGDWATTFDNREGAKVPMVKLIAPIAIPHHCKSAIALAMKLVCLQPPLQQMQWSKTLCCHREKQCRQGCTTQQSTLLIAEAITTKIAFHSLLSRMRRLR